MGPGFMNNHEMTGAEVITIGQEVIIPGATGKHYRVFFKIKQEPNKYYDSQA